MLMAALAAVELHQEAPPAGFVIDEAKRAERLDQPAEFLESAGQLGRALLGLQGPDQARGLHRAELQGAGQAQQVLPVPDDERGADALGGQVVESAVVGPAVHAPEPSAPMSAGRGLNW